MVLYLHGNAMKLGYSQLPLTPTPPRGTLYLMVVTCLLGMSIPAGPVSKHNPVLSAKWLRCACFWSVKQTFMKKTE